MLDSCRVCGGTEARPAALVRGSQYVRCALCGVERMAKYPSAQELAAFYDSGYMSQRDDNPSIHIHFSEGYRESYFSEKDLTLADLKLEHSHLAGKRVLDVGCANGQFIEYLKRRGVEGAQGIDVSAEMVEIARKNGHSCQVRELFDMKGEYDCLFFWDVIEHMTDPREAIGKAGGLLKDGGELVIQTPCTGMVSELFGESWLYYMPVEHIHLFSQESLFRLLSEEGFSVVNWVRFGSCNPAGSIPAVNKRAMDTIAKRLGIGDTIALRARRSQN
ncbi:MAG TPA: class I SAM-dependent methyltransferase [Thermodesulfobacteriota bacterium]